MHLPFWQDLLQLLEGSLSRDAIRLWLNPLTPVLISDDKLILEAPNCIHERIVRQRYLEAMRRAAHALSGRALLIDFVLVSEDGGVSKQRPDRFPTVSHPQKPSCLATLNPNYTFQNFVIGSCNRAPYSAALATARKPGRKHNPLFITGGVGLGKTHLVQAIGAEIIAEEKHSLVYIPSDRLMDVLMEAFKNREIGTVRRRLSSVNVLIIDDIHSLSGKNQIQEEFFSIFNALYQKKSQVVLTSDRPPREIPHLHQRLVSRFESGLIVQLNPPALKTRMLIIEKKARLLGLTLPRGVVMLLASRIRTNVRRMEGALNKIAAHATIWGSVPDEEGVERLLQDGLLDGDEQSVSIRGIQRKVAEHFQIKIGTLLGHERSSRIVFPRQIAMYLCRKLISSPYADIAAAFSGRDHTAAIHSYRTIEGLLRSNTETRETVDSLITAIKA
ncbi:MAG: chromosomal replication initiator protein DnaA [bacterium]